MSNYWQKRFQILEDANNKRAKETVQAITPAFDQAQAQIEKEINAWYARFAKNNKISLQEAKKLLNSKELKEFRWDVEEYIKYGRENALDQKWMKELENASARFHVSRLEALKIRTQNAAERAFGNELDQLDQMAARLYMDDYYHTAYEIQKGLGVGFDVAQIDQRKLDNLLSKPWTTDNKTFKDRIWTKKTSMISELHNQMTRMCILGTSPDEAIKEMEKFVDSKFKNAKMAAGRLVMTESAYFASAAQKDCFNDLDVEKYEIVATLDSHTSEICQKMDGQVFDMKDFQAGVTAPPFHVWCRSCTCPWFEDNDDGQRAARDADGKTYYVPANMKYQDWKDHFVDKIKDPADWLQAIDKDDIVKVEGFAEKIQGIKDRIAQNGGTINESDLQEAGKLFQEELLKDTKYTERIQKIDDLNKQQASAYKKYKTFTDDLYDFKKQNPEFARAIDEYESLEWWVQRRPDNEDFARRFNEAKETIEQIKPDWFDLKKQQDELYEAYKLKRKQWDDLRINFEYDNAEDVKRILSQVREMGSDGIDIKKHLCNSKSEVTKYVEQAYSYYPKEWVDASVKHGTMKPKKVQRGYYGGSEIAISGSGADAFATSVHELGHRMEVIVPEIKKAEKAFYARRTDGEDLKWLGSGYRRDEKTRKDDFLHPYMGKDYGGSWYELVSMGFEYGYTDPSYLMKDPDMASWIYGILTLH